MLPADASAQWVVGVHAGLPAFSVAGRAPEGASYGRQVRVMAAGVLGYRLGPSFVLRLEPGLAQRGAGVAYDVDGVEEPVDSLSVRLDYLSVPLVAQVFTPGGRGFVTTGVELGVLTSATVTPVRGGDGADVEALLDGRDLSWMFGVGGLVRRGRPEAWLELRYSQSLTTVFDGAPGASGLPGALRSSGFALIGGLSWSLGGGR